MNDQKIVYFSEWCQYCMHFKSKETDAPCDECLTYSTNIDTHKPVNFEEKNPKPSTKRRKK